MLEQKWRTIQSKSLLKDRWIDVRADTCLTPSGVEISPYYVLTYPDWVHIVAVTTDGELVLVRQYRQAIDQILNEIPGGIADEADGDFEQAARRELAEETGYEAADWKLIASLYPNPATHTNHHHIYLARGAYRAFEPKLDAGEEGLHTFTVPVGQVLRDIPTGFLSQSMHVASVLLALAGQSGNDNGSEA